MSTRRFHVIRDQQHLSMCKALLSLSDRSIQSSSASLEHLSPKIWQLMMLCIYGLYKNSAILARHCSHLANGIAPRACSG